MHDEHRYDQCRNLGGLFDFLVHFSVWSKFQMAIKCKNIINILYLLLWVHFQRSGRLDGLLANKFLYFSLVKHFYQILYGLNGPVITWYHI